MRLSAIALLIALCSCRISPRLDERPNGQNKPARIVDTPPGCVRGSPCEKCGCDQFEWCGSVRVGEEGLAVLAGKTICHGMYVDGRGP